MPSSPQPLERLTLPFRGVRNDDSIFLPLNPDKLEIRCVILLPGSGDDPIACELVYTDMYKDSDAHIPYVALSYCWGDIDDIVEILLYGPSTNSSDGCQQPISAPFRITRNLYIALTALRNDGKQYLWIDAICINQQDLQEKTHQVQLMGKIYSSAESVVVWLGPEDKHSQFLLRAWTAHLVPLIRDLNGDDIKNWYREIYKTQHPLWNGMAEDETLGKLALDFPVNLRNDITPDWYKKATSVSFDFLFSRPWWSRMWVLQEVLLAPKINGGDRKVEFILGDNKLHWRDVQHMGDILEGLSETNWRFIPRTHRAIRAAWRPLFLLDRHDLNSDISELLVFTQRWNATDPRDKLFALLLLASDTRECFWHERLIIPDYTKPTKAVFDDLVQWKPSLKGIEIYVEGIGMICLTGDSNWSKRNYSYWGHWGGGKHPRDGA